MDDWVLGQGEEDAGRVMPARSRQFPLLGLQLLFTKLYVEL